MLNIKLNVVLLLFVALKTSNNKNQSVALLWQTAKKIDFSIWLNWMKYDLGTGLNTFKYLGTYWLDGDAVIHGQMEMRPAVIWGWGEGNLS